jgi:polyisoprenoid-binding protein YceI
MKLVGRGGFLVVALLVGLGFGVLGLSAQIRPQSAPEGGQAGKTFEVDTKVSRVYVRVDPDGRGHDHGIAGQLASGTVTLGASEKAGEWVFDLTSFDADDPEARKYVGVEGEMNDSDRRSITRTMLGSQVLDTKQYPKATYTITAAAPLDDQAAGDPGRYRFDGRLSLHGVEQSLRFEAKAERAKAEGALQLRGEFALAQTDYKIKPYSALFGALKVKDELRVYGDLLLVPKASK